ncbi:MAG: helix-turn-helix domain-containing protein [Victivallaceae bacterium]|nr:helix-turn-helix domain-containing protein [Victivallaceae bacterium]
MSIIDQLHALDLNGRQAKIYLAALQLGSASAIEIAKYTSCKHPTVYDALDVLKQRGLVSESTVNNRRLFSAENPEVLLQEEERRMNKLEALLPDLKGLYAGGRHHTRIRLFEGEEGRMTISNELLNVREKKYYYFGSLRNMFARTSSELEEEYYRLRMERGIWSYSIRDRAGEVDYDYMLPGDRNLRRVRFWPGKLEDSVSGLYIYDDRIAVASTLKENYVLVVESRELNILMRNIWNLLWEIAEEP